MEKMLKTPPKSAVHSDISDVLGDKTQDQNQPMDLDSPSSIRSKFSTPGRLKVPKPLKYAERYTSPTDLMVSPVSKGLLARSGKSVPLLPPSNNQHKSEDSKLELGLFAKLEV